ncbi:MAG: hypothetical protein OWQ59_06640 [Alicyclobacillaceae bacterium]|jgi:hypothetical protein|uniref:hypothetical protein n=1 Tax=Alicyclobacillus sp. SP_1 TaxID=2942475 RepID=UPI002157E0F6|nr:hypothetical protein [Alicyclobacillus sp. SP_1]MCY0888121.1 hypothetical protein [Alicyclobacillaceae bacterium]MCY0895278.1 hypothetical protein [Alicyclobacillaceae bacterium]
MRFVARRRPYRWWQQPRWLIVFGILMAVGGFELTRYIIPFEARNPLFHEVTIGEPVIEHWKYGGVDEEGYLRFYNGIQTIVLPPGSHMFGADGTFVMLEHHNATSLTYADPLEALPLRWIIVILSSVGAVVGFVAWRLRVMRRPLRTKSSTPYARIARVVANFRRKRRRRKLF